MKNFEKLVELHQSDSHQAELVIDKLEADSFEFEKILAMIHGQKCETMKVAEKVLLALFPSQLHYKDLLFFFWSNDQRITEQTKILLKKVPVETLEWEKIVLEFENTHPQIQEVASNWLAQIPSQDFDFGKLIEFTKNKYYAVQYCAQALILKHFREEVPYELLISFLKSGKIAVIDGAREVLVQRFPDMLSWELLVDDFQSESRPVQKLVWELLDAVPAEELDSEKLIRCLTYQYVNRERDQSVIELLKKIPERIDLDDLFGIFRFNYDKTERQVDKILEKMPKEVFKCETLLEYTRGKNKDIKGLARKILIKYFSRQLTYELRIELHLESLEDSKKLTQEAKEVLSLFSN